MLLKKPRLTAIVPRVKLKLQLMLQPSKPHLFTTLKKLRKSKNMLLLLPNIQIITLLRLLFTTNMLLVKLR